MRGWLAGAMWGVAALLPPSSFAALSAPSGLSATNVRATSFTLRWAAATGGTGGITGYDVYRDGTLLGSATTRSFAVAGLAPTTTYHMTVVARDGAGQISPPSAALAVTTDPDTTDPTRPADLAASAVTTNSFTLTWTASTDNVGVTGYDIYRAGEPVGTTQLTSFNLTGLTSNTKHRVTVKAVDAAGNISGASTALVVWTLAAPPSAPADLSVANLKATSFTLKWAASTGGAGGIAGYGVYQDGVLFGSVTTRFLTVTGLEPATTYHMAVTARDDDGRLSPPSAALVVTTEPDTTKPKAPTGLTAINLASTSFTLSWTAATDAVGVTGYNVYRAGVLLGSTSVTTRNLTGLTPGSSNKMTVRATDAAGNLSAASAALMVITPLVAANLPPQVALFAPAEGATLSAGIPFTLSVTASDPDGTVARVEFFDGTNKLGETSSPAGSPPLYALVFTPVAGTHALTAVAYDNAGAQATSPPVHINAVADTALFRADFELAAGYTPGPLDGQKGWVSTGSNPARVTAEVAQSGQQSVILPPTPGDFNAVQLTLAPLAAGQSVLFYDFWTKPGAGADLSLASQFFLGGTPFLALVGTGNQAEVQAFGPNQGSVDQWRSGFSVPLAPDGTTADWLRLTFRQDYSAGKWDVYVDGQPALFDLPSAGAGMPQLNVLSHQSIATRLDTFTAVPENPLFGDVDRDGMDDAWETAHGLDPARNDRDGDPDGDGLINAQEFVHGTDPHNADTDGDGLTDGQEVPLGTNPRAADTDGDGLSDGWEASHGLDPRSAADAALDPDGDGLTNLQEYAAGSDPGDPLNGSLPQIISLVAADGALGPNDTLSVRITNSAERPLPGVPVRFISTTGGHRLAASADGPAGYETTVITGLDGIATVHLKKPRAGGGGE